jgi:hypothetical protein
MSIQDRMNDIMTQIENRKPELVKYYIGDLCYVMHDVWSEVCDLTLDPFDDENDTFFELEDGRTFFLMGTTYGDGQYNDTEGRPYGVDSGTIGAIRLEDIRDLEGLQRTTEGGYGQIVEFYSELDPMDVYDDNGTLCFGNVFIDTAGDSDEDSEGEEEFEDEEDA